MKQTGASGRCFRPSRSITQGLRPPVESVAEQRINDRKRAANPLANGSLTSTGCAHNRQSPREGNNDE